MRIEKGCNHINLIKVELFLYCNYYKKYFVSLRFHHCRESFKIVNTLTLFKPFCNLVHFILLDIVFNIWFAFESLLSC